MQIIVLCLGMKRYHHLHTVDISWSISSHALLSTPLLVSSSAHAEGVTRVRDSPASPSTPLQVGGLLWAEHCYLRTALCNVVTHTSINPARLSVSAEQHDG